VIRLWFSERPESSLTVVSLKDANGKAVALTAPQNDRDNPLMIAVRVSQPLPDGRYTVAWQTAGSDGHPSHGAFSFVVLTEEPARPNASGLQGDVAQETNPGALSTGVSSTRGENVEESDVASSMTNSFARAFSFVGLLMLIGATTFRALVLPRPRGISIELKARMEQRAAVLGLVASFLVIVGALAKGFLMSQMMSAMPDVHVMSMTDVAMHTRWGRAFRLELGMATVAFLSFALAARRVRGAWVVASISGLVLAATPALAGHAAATPRFTSLMIFTDYLHVIGGASWLGSLLAVMVVGVPVSLTLAGVERWSSIASLVNSFSPTALASVSIVVVSGAIASFVHLEDVSALWQTPYGQVLLLKLFLVAITLSIGAYNFRGVQPQLLTEVGSARLRLSTAIELAAGFLILLVTGFLTGISP